MGRRRVKAIRVGMETVVELAMGSERGMERDVILERKVEMRGGASGMDVGRTAHGIDSEEQGIVLDEGIQRWVNAHLCRLCVRGALDELLTKTTQVSVHSLGTVRSMRS